MLYRALWVVFTVGCARPLVSPAGLVEHSLLSVHADFEKDTPGHFPAGWDVPKAALADGFNAAVTVNGAAHKGRRAVALWGAPKRAGGFGYLKKTIDARPYRGQVVRFRAAVRTNVDAWTGVGLWLRVDRPGGKTGFFDNMQDRPIVAPTWGTFEIVGLVSPDAASISLGLLLHGKGTVWFDDFEFEVIGAAEPPRKLAGRGLANLVAFTRLLGYVRFFHPSDEAAQPNWNAFAVAGVRAVEESTSPADAAARLAKSFAPVAPTVRVFATGTKHAPKPHTALAPPRGATDLRVLMWRHTGFGTDGSMYHSERVTQEWTSSGVLAPFADPQRLLTVDLGGGVSAHIPIALFEDSKGTLPHSPQKNSDHTPNDYVQALLATSEDRSTRLAAVALTWTVFQHFYPYFDVVEVDWATALEDALASAATDSDARAFEDTVARMLSQLHDGHARVYGADDPSARPALTWGVVEGQLVVLTVDSTTTSANGVRAGDAVLAVDGKPALDALAAELPLVSAATPQFAEWKALQRLAAGPLGSAITLTVQSPHESGSRTITMLRTAELSGWHTERRPERIAEIAPGIWYVDVERVSDREFKAALSALAGAKGVIFDVRGYPFALSPDFLSYLSDHSLQSAQWHVPIIMHPDGQDWTFNTTGRWELWPNVPRVTGKIAFLTDARAVSQAETDLGIAEYYHLGAIVGGTTAGTNGNVNSFEIPGGLTVAFTGMKVLKHDGSQHHAVGISPTVPVRRTIAEVTAGRDEILMAACKVVGGACQ